MPDWVVAILQSYGLAGVVIAGLVTVVVVQYRSSSTINVGRLGEREILIKALEANTSAIRDNAKATDDRNKVTEQLADAIDRLASAFEMFSSKAEMNQQSLREKFADQKMVVDAMAESGRTNTGVLRDIRRDVEALLERVR